MITERAPAKINLALHVRQRRPDGYHDIETLFAFAADGDVVTVEGAARDRFAIVGPFAAGLDAEADNLVTRAARAFVEAFGIVAAHAITLDKRLPIASGIGGGSADAAATLRALARLHAVPLDDARLYRIAAALGADVPACLDGRTTLGTGKGDALVAIDGLAGTPLLLVNPGVAVSTAAVFRTWDGVDRGGIGEGDLLARARAGRNDLEPPALALAPVIGAVRAVLDAAPGVLLSRMSGSGATCFALFDEAGACAAAAAEARARGWWTLQTFLT
ncbi:4-(cytidine 5'-diphospho)-2-C-methyl-D-erythritol kinase [Sphingomonas ginsenosidivorax]|uniref:4-diphosphocytidyl-2-C-methyl-D-erythritol kinase n=1 Tax=Sphingomonas ginsenosidivorax TaxID=862135 RepID=A0A5C6UFY3_9SPHN|nr:4-(cytidine 5'-diphospho)-2-C-methyl-D-erythritol kinase [Sphingomonas ginsenosidivorax]TXC70945.1 4-(cytidine 5'-diphospho)-2-C-methyl-D-erythritol kinase [Sphingomonas ginsenosidivorax]